MLLATCFMVVKLAGAVLQVSDIDLGFQSAHVLEKSAGDME